MDKLPAPSQPIRNSSQGRPEQAFLSIIGGFEREFEDNLLSYLVPIGWSKITFLTEGIAAIVHSLQKPPIG